MSMFYMCVRVSLCESPCVNYLYVEEFLSTFINNEIG
jgi:hypothetical protein